MDFSTKLEAVAEARKEAARCGVTLIVFGVEGDVQDVKVVSQEGRQPILGAHVKHRRSNHNVNIAIARVLEKES